MIHFRIVKIVCLILLLCSCERKHEKLIPLFEQTKAMMKEEELLDFKSAHIDSLDFYTGRHHPPFNKAAEKKPSLENDAIAYLDAKRISQYEPIRYLYLCFCFHMYLNETTFSDEEIFEKIKQNYKRRGIELNGNLSNVIFPEDKIPEGMH